MSMPISNSLGVQMCMSSDYKSGATTNYYGAAAAPAYTAPQQSYYHSQNHGSSLIRARPRSGKTAITLQENIFHWNLSFAFSLMANSLNLNPVYYYTLRNLLLLNLIIKNQQSNFANVKFREFDLSEPGR